MLPRATENTVVGHMRPMGRWLDYIVLDSNIKMAKSAVERKKVYSKHRRKKIWKIFRKAKKADEKL